MRLASAYFTMALCSGLFSAALAVPVSSGDTLRSSTEGNLMALLQSRGLHESVHPPMSQRSQQRREACKVTFRAGVAGQDGGESGDQWNVRDVVTSFLSQEGIYTATSAAMIWENGYKPEGTGLIQFEFQAPDGPCHTARCRLLLIKPVSNWSIGQQISGLAGLHGESWYDLHQAFDRRFPSFST
ncbi:hypothetical protein GGU10DRAFT_104127 [Lentinula aff. detonsa]|uniref:Uncharacterized protein n=1 Tax=Lentinula aff. detonsa TaxID=2804958 RepID=A0AA38NTW4_9AGAR|nr:hypothetical protein GGU10DRAFT_104127 [Lentinula aff. detonsa]